MTDVSITAKYFTGEAKLVESRYHDGSPALLLRSVEGEPIATITVCAEEPLPAGSFLVKTWSENEGIVESLIEQGILLDTGATVRVGFSDAPVCRFAQ